MPARFDPELIQRGARLRRSPFFEATQRAGCLGYTIYNHMLLPIRYDDFEAEYRKLLADVTLWDVAVERNVEVAGPDGLRFAQLLTPRDLSKCPAGEGRYVVLADESGGIVTTRCSCGSTRTASGSPAPTATCCSGRRESRAAALSRSSYASSTSPRCRSRGRNRRT